MIRQGDRHLCEWRYGMASRFHTALFASMMFSTEVELNRISLGFPEEVDAYRRYQKDSGFWNQIEAEWRAAWPALYGSKAGGPMGQPAPKERRRRGLLYLLRRLP